MTAVYHLGYSDFRSSKVRKPVTGDLVWSVPTLTTLNPIGAPIAHMGLHVSAVVHNYNTTLFCLLTRRSGLIYGASDWSRSNVVSSKERGSSMGSRWVKTVAYGSWARRAASTSSAMSCPRWTVQAPGTRMWVETKARCPACLAAQGVELHALRSKRVQYLIDLVLDVLV